MLSINIMATLSLFGTVMAVPYHGHHHFTRLHRPHGSAPVGTASGLGPYPYPSANGTGIWGTTGRGGPTAASSSLPAYIVPTPSSSVEAPASSSSVAAASTSLSSVGAPASSSNVAASPVGPAEQSVTLENYGALTSTCTTAITVTATEKVYVTVTPGYSSSAGSSTSTLTIHTTSTLTVESTIFASSSSVAAESTMAPANSSAIYSASSGYAPFPANSTSSAILSTATGDIGRYHRHSTWASSYSSAIIASSSLPSSVLTSSVSVPVSSSAAAPTTSMSSVYVAPTTSMSSVYATPTTSSAAATSTSASSSGSGKRGLAYNDASLTECFESSNEISWAYNWASSSSGLSSKFKFIPTLWGSSSDFTNSWNANAKAAIASGSTHLMSFNEPDLSSQSNLSPEAAAAAYRTWMMPFANTGVKLGAPSVTNGGGSMGLTWLQNFMTACSDCQIDFVNIHWYDSYSNSDYFKSHVQDANTISGGKPVFVSEFGCTDGSADEISGFLETVMPWMDSQSYIEGYAYFMVSNGLLVNGNTPSTYGSTYMSYTG
ncbi:glycoside hydrolase family 128 protein, protein [Acrodontium crateriforme]|uniref:Glycoside hydrolase family 128 protein, protein n=1 Tax=Acrodontium crateriforme TaxID=150365 RepID=A0AAQ3R9E0_9PEZI|nr:glycoside hydrolase family 128 protein, protein [Acrodontium crateriforme]